jgi:ribosome modulation factor
MPRAAKPTRLPGSGKISATSEVDFFVKQGDFQAIAAGRPMMYYRDPDKARTDWLRGWREFFEESFPAQVGAVDAALGTAPSETDDGDDDGDDVA